MGQGRGEQGGTAAARLGSADSGGRVEARAAVAGLAATDHESLATQAAPYARTVVQWVAGRAGDLGGLLVHFLLTVLLTAILYTTGETAASGVRRFARRLAGGRGDDSVVLAGQAVRAVALGVVVTALVQSAASGIGLAIVGIPYAAVLTLSCVRSCCVVAKDC